MRQMPIVRSNPAQTAIVSVLTLAAITLLGLVLAYWTWAWLGPRPEPRAQDLTAPIGRTAAAGALFGRVPAGNAADAPTGLSIKLVGVVAAKGERPGYALIQVDANQILAVRAGEDVAPGIRLEKVFPDHVTLVRTGTSESLALVERRKPVPSPVPGAGK